MINHIHNKSLLAGVLTAVFATASIFAQNANYAPGDLVLYFQKEGGSNTVYANLGNAATLYRGATAGPGATNRINFININAELTSAFGANWASDTTLYAGLAGVWGTSSTSTALQDGDPQRTIYISCPRSDVGTTGTANSVGWDMTLAGNTAMTNGATGIQTQNNVLETVYTTAVEVSPTSISTIDEQNPFASPGIQGNAFQNNFAGGVQQAGTSGSFGSLGSAGTVEFALDLYRILARNTVSGQVAGDLRVGSFEGTITVNASGMVSFISEAAAPSSTFTAWADSFSSSLPNAADRLATADPDNDGLDNLAEFVLNGNPSAADASIAPAISTSGSDFVFSFNRRDDSESEVTAVFQYGSDLSGWTDVTIGAGNETAGSANITVTENDSAADAISVTIPKSVAVNGKLYGRLKMSR